VEILLDAIFSLDLPRNPREETAQKAGKNKRTLLGRLIISSYWICTPVLDATFGKNSKRQTRKNNIKKVAQPHVITGLNLKSEISHVPFFGV